MGSVDSRMAVMAAFRLYVDCMREWWRHACTMIEDGGHTKTTPGEGAAARAGNCASRSTLGERSVEVEGEGSAVRRAENLPSARLTPAPPAPFGDDSSDGEHLDPTGAAADPAGAAADPAGAAVNPAD